MARAAPATAGLAIAADAQFPVDFFPPRGRKRPRASTPKGSRKTVVGCSYTTPHIVDYQRVSPFWGQGTPHGKAGEGQEITLE